MLAEQTDEQTDERAEGRRYLGLDVLAGSRLTLVTDRGPTEETTTDEETHPALTA